MAAYFAMRMEKGRLNYNAVVERYPDYKADIDLILTADGYTVKDDGSVVKNE